MINIKKLLFILYLFIFTFISSSHANNNGHDSITILAIGDTPYSKKEELDLNNKVIPTIKKSDYPFIVVYGDILSGKESCTNKLLTKRLNTFYHIKKDRVFYTPGDNSWTDCDRSFKDKSFSELERLTYIRSFITANKQNPPKQWKYKQQKELIENASWYYDEVKFATMHIVSTNNGRIEILKDDINKALNQVDARDEANLHWLRKTFDDANKNNARAVIIISQADITRSKEKDICTKSNRVTCNPFKNFTNHLRLEAKQFVNNEGQEKPVLFLHGDSNPYCFDKKFGKDITSNLWRLNAWGDWKQDADATVVKFNPNNKNNPFEAHTLLSNELPKNKCKN